MKIEFHIEGAASAAAFAAFLPQYQAALKADEEAWRAKAHAEGNIPAAISAAPATETTTAEEAPAEKPKRTRKAAEPAPNITATPEAREPVAEPEPAKEITADDIRTALNAIVAKFGMPYATSNVQRLLGAPKVGAVDPATYPEVLARLEAELAAEDING